MGIVSFSDVENRRLLISRAANRQDRDDGVFADIELDIIIVITEKQSSFRIQATQNVLLFLKNRFRWYLYLKRIFE